MPLSLSIPTLRTDRLVLRAPEAADFEPVAAFFADAERAKGFSGPFDRRNAWRWFAGMIGHWALRGYGFWIVDTAEGETVGMVGLWYPDGWLEPELGWVMFAAGEGRGFAYEAAIEVRRYAYEELGFKTLCSNIIPGNERSIALAERLGAFHERTYENVSHGTELVFRHPPAVAAA